MGFIFLIEFFIFGILIYRIYMKSKNRICRSKKRLDGKTCLVIGGTSGLGLEISIDFALRGARVIVACPFIEEGTNAEKKIIEESGNINVIFKLLDLSCFESVRNFAADILDTEQRLDILMNNAGIAASPVDPKKELENGFSLVMRVNYLGHFLVTLLLLPLLRKTGKPTDPSRIVNTSSVMHRFAVMDVDNLAVVKNRLFDKYIVYSNSKLCLLLFSRELMKKLPGSNVVINNVDPGEVSTRIFLMRSTFYAHILFWFMWFIGNTPFEGAQTALHVALDDKAGETSGLYFRNCKVCKPAKAAFDKDLSKRVWKKSMELVNLGDEQLRHLLE